MLKLWVKSLEIDNIFFENNQGSLKITIISNFFHIFEIAVLRKSLNPKEVTSIKKKKNYLIL